jgi:hypothetical protein
MKRDIKIISTVITIFCAIFLLLYIGMATVVNDPIIDQNYINMPLLAWLYIFDLIFWIVGITLYVDFEK